jgi:hypothetical protein
MESRAQEHGGAWLDVRDAAAYLACSTKRIYDLVAQRRCASPVMVVGCCSASSGWMRW